MGLNVGAYKLGAASAGGSVTSFSAGNLSPLFTTSVATATSTPALTFAGVSQAQNLFFASPNGSAAVPSFRAIVLADLPNSGVPALAANQIGVGSGTNLLTSSSGFGYNNTTKVFNVTFGSEIWGYIDATNKQFGLGALSGGGTPSGYYFSGDSTNGIDIGVNNVGVPTQIFHVEAALNGSGNLTQLGDCIGAANGTGLEIDDTAETFTFLNPTATITINAFAGGGTRILTANNSGVVGVTSLPTGGFSTGTYSPTRSAEANLDANVTFASCKYSRMGDMVTVSGRFTADPTLTATATSFEMTLPIASNLAAAGDVSGTAFCGAIAAMGAECIAVAANDTAKIQWISSDVTSKTWSFIFQYQII